jgi:hypothetical protein
MYVCKAASSASVRLLQGVRAHLGGVTDLWTAVVVYLLQSLLFFANINYYC